MNLYFSARAPFSFQMVVMSHGWMQLAPFSFDQGTGVLAYVDRLSTGRVVSYHIQEAQTGVQVEVLSDLVPGEIEEVKQRVGWMLDLEADFTPFYALARAEPKLAKAVERAAGRLLRSPTFFEDIVKTLLTTNTLWAATRRMAVNLTQHFGEALVEDASMHAFPTAASLAGAGAEALKEKGRLGYRAPYVYELALSTVAGELDPEAFKTSTLATPELRKELIKIKGVGSYAAANLLVLLGRYDYLPVDSWAFKMVSKEWFGGEPVGPKEVDAAFARWGEWKGLAYWFWEWS